MPIQESTTSWHRRSQSRPLPEHSLIASDQQQGRSNRPVFSVSKPMPSIACWLLLIATLLICGSGCQLDQFWVRQPRLAFPPALQQVNYLSDLKTVNPPSASSKKSAAPGSEDQAAEDPDASTTAPALRDGSAEDNEDPIKEGSDNPSLTQESGSVVKLVAAVSAPPPSPLTLPEVVESVLESLPQLRAIYEEIGIAQGNLTAAQGSFDLNVSGSTITQPLGFYENYRHSLGLSQNVMSTGANLYAGYRLGRGSFPAWYKERETNEGGELAIGTTIPLRKDRLLDARRAAVFRAQQDVSAVEPVIRNERNLMLRDARIAYWGWLASGQALRTQRTLLELAQARAKVIEPLVERGDLPELARIDNQRLIAQREAKFVEATRKFQASAIKLSLYLRDAQGNMLFPEEAFLGDFPQLDAILREQLNSDIQLALSNHPQLQQLEFEIEKARIDVAEARNQVLGKLDGFAETSQDLGAPASSSRDKSPLEMQVGLMGELPLQRRAGCGKLTATQAKLRQLEWKQEFLANKINISVQDNYSAMLNADERFLKARTNVALARQSLGIAMKQFDNGDIDLIVLNIYEQAVADAELTVIEAELEFFLAQAEYFFALGRF